MTRLEKATEDLAREIFDAYNAQGPNPWKTFDGRDVPRWDGLNEQVRAKWCAASRRALEVVTDGIAEVLSREPLS